MDRLLGQWPIAQPDDQPWADRQCGDPVEIGAGDLKIFQDKHCPPYPQLVIRRSSIPLPATTVERNDMTVSHHSSSLYFIL